MSTPNNFLPHHTLHTLLLLYIFSTLPLHSYNQTPHLKFSSSNCAFAFWGSDKLKRGLIVAMTMAKFVATLFLALIALSMLQTMVGLSCFILNSLKKKKFKILTLLTFSFLFCFVLFTGYGFSWAWWSSLWQHCKLSLKLRHCVCVCVCVCVCLLLCYVFGWEWNIYILVLNLYLISEQVWTRESQELP